jgi:hypothetical protein
MGKPVTDPADRFLILLTGVSLSGGHADIPGADGCSALHITLRHRLRLFPPRRGRIGKIGIGADHKHRQRQFPAELLDFYDLSAEKIAATVENGI